MDGKLMCGQPCHHVAYSMAGCMVLALARTTMTVIWTQAFCGRQYDFSSRAGPLPAQRGALAPEGAVQRRRGLQLDRRPQGGRRDWWDWWWWRGGSVLVEDAIREQSMIWLGARWLGLLQMQPWGRAMISKRATGNWLA